MSKKPSSPKPASPDNKELKSPKGDSVIQDPKAKPGNPKQQTGAQPEKGKNDKPAEKGKAGKSPEPVDKSGKPIKDNKQPPGKGGKPGDHGGIFLTEGKTHEPAPKPENVLVGSGLLEAYDYLQRQICKHGLPKGNAFEFAAITFLKYERKLKAKEADKRVEITNKEKEREEEKKRKLEAKEIDNRGGRSPRGRDVKSPDPKGKSSDARGKSPEPTKGKEDPKGKGGKGAQSPPPKEDEKGKGKGGKDDRSKSPDPKNMKKEDAVVDKKKGAEDPKAKKK